MRFAIANDGFNPFGKCNSTHSCWPVVLVPYNFPPWLCMKASSLMLTLIIPGYPGKDFHTFMQPVYDDLNELFEYGMPTYDAYRDEVFQLHAVLLYTVSDYPGAGILAQFSTNSQLGCLSCEEETSYKWLKYKQCYIWGIDDSCLMAMSFDMMPILLMELKSIDQNQYPVLEKLFWKR